MCVGVVFRDVIKNKLRHWLVAPEWVVTAGFISYRIPTLTHVTRYIITWRRGFQVCVTSLPKYENQVVTFRRLIGCRSFEWAWLLQASSDVIESTSLSGCDLEATAT